MPRNLIFLHIPKCAGSTLREIIYRQYPDRQCYYVSSMPDQQQSIYEFQGLPRAEREEIRFLTGHGVYGLHSSLVGSTEYITMLRKPIERVISNYYYVARSPEHRHYETVTGEKGMSLYEYVSSGVNEVLDNQMVRSMTSDDEISGRKLLQRAKENWDEWFGFVGLVERFDESLLLAKERYGWGGVFYRKRNVTRDRPSREDLPERVVDEIEARNRLDTELYEYGKERLSAELEAADIGRKLSSFRRKCWVHGKKVELNNVARQVKGQVGQVLHSMGLR